MTPHTERGRPPPALWRMGNAVPLDQKRKKGIPLWNPLLKPSFFLPVVFMLLRM